MSVGTLAGRAAWVTGSGRGIGRATAHKLASMGADVAVHGTAPTSTRITGEGESLQALADELARTYGVRSVAVWGDLTDEEVVDRCVAGVRQGLGRVDILVNFAGGDIGARGMTGPNLGKPEGNDAIHMSVADMRSVLDRNLMTTILCCRAVGPEMMERRSGRIVNVGSFFGLYGRVTEAIYSTAKAAVHEYTRCLAALMRPYNVNVNAVAPGAILSPRYMQTRPIDESQKLEGGTLERYGWPREIAEAVGFLVSDAAGYISGQVLRIDGGTQLWPA